MRIFATNFPPGQIQIIKEHFSMCYDVINKAFKWGQGCPGTASLIRVAYNYLQHVLRMNVLVYKMMI